MPKLIPAMFSLEDTSPQNLELYNFLPVAIYTCNKDGIITYYNDAAVKLWGRTPETGKDLWCGSWTILDSNGNDMPLATCPMALTLKEGRAIEGEEIIVARPDGSRVNVLPFPVPLFNGAGELIGAVNTLIDITAQKHDEEKRARLAAIIESSDDAIVSKTLQGIVTSWNKGAQNLFGYSEAEMLGQSITKLIPPGYIDEETTILGKISRGEKVEHYETVRVTKQGKPIHVSLSISPIKDSKNNILGASKIARDITRQKLTEERLVRHAENLEILNLMGKTISESLDVSVILQKVTDATTILSGAAFGAFFYNKVDETGESYTLYALAGAPREAFEKFGMPRNTAVFNHTFTGKGIVRVDNITKDPRYGHNFPDHGMPEGHLPVVSYLAVPVKSKSGKVIGGLFFGHPEPAMFTENHEVLISAVSSQAGMALENAALYEEIKSLSAKKDEFISLASHELKTPVTGLRGYLEIVDMYMSEGDNNKVFIKKALYQIAKLVRLVEDLLNVAKIESGKLPLSCTHFDIIQLVTDVIELMQFSTNTHKIVLETEYPQLEVYADKNRIEQVLINLISNAIKYSYKADLVKIRITTSGNDPIVSVQDFGVGIEQTQHEQIFSRFYRINDTKNSIPGLGIGLFISKEIIERHNGKLWMESEPGKGSTFSFQLPASPV